MQVIDMEIQRNIQIYNTGYVLIQVHSTPLNHITISLLLQNLNIFQFPVKEFLTNCWLSVVLISITCLL